ncbi:MAG: PDZ domain-containing protein [Verrucomicrobiota bacterium]
MKQISYKIAAATLLLAAALLRVGAPAATLNGDTDPDRLWCKVTINGFPARMQFDTGASEAVLFSNKLARFHLHFVSLPEAERQRYPPIVSGKTEPCDLGLGNETNKAEFFVCNDPPEYLPAEDTGDGVVGWSNLRSNAIALNVGTSGLTILPHLPADIAGYIPFSIDTNATVLTLTRTLNTKRGIRILVDTGASLGLRLPPAKWKQWKEAHPTQPVTVGAFWGQRGTEVSEQGWTDKYTIGPLIWSEIVCICDRGVDEIYDARLGIDALKHLEILLDAQRGLAYLRQREPGRHLSRRHNRLGALFMPNPESGALTAHVASPSPAEEADIQPGDRLTKINELDTTRWLTDPGILPLGRFWQQPAGTQLTLTLQRDEQTVTKTVTLKNILPPDAMSRPPSAHSSNHKDN